ncbi:unnamed protein product [Prunus armeniaca]|uniref:DUF1499 domain-containing protein n=1 Tax=Prunus armeniaca TaxID=36596 RepID=A0A6J5X5B6_PRUAR|nr:unnamed protein product [Prunus armeniaca]
MILLFTAVLLAGGNEYGQCSEEPERKDDTGRPLRRDIVIPQRCEGFKTISMTEKFSCRVKDLFEILMDENRWKNGSLIVQNWRFGSWPDGIDSTVRLILEEPKPGLTLYGNVTVVENAQRGWRDLIFQRIRAVFGFGI